MAASWQSLLRGREFRMEDGGVFVALGERAHRVDVIDSGEHYLLSAVVARPRVTDRIEDVALRAWLRNRATTLVGFRLDGRKRLVAESMVPKAGLTAEEFQVYARTVARESDRFEFELTGEDLE